MHNPSLVCPPWLTNLPPHLTPHIPSVNQTPSGAPSAAATTPWSSTFTSTAEDASAPSATTRGTRLFHRRPLIERTLPPPLYRVGCCSVRLGPTSHRGPLRVVTRHLSLRTATCRRIIGGRPTERCSSKVQASKCRMRLCPICQISAGSLSFPATRSAWLGLLPLRPNGEHFFGPTEVQKAARCRPPGTSDDRTTDMRSPQQAVSPKQGFAASDTAASTVPRVGDNIYWLVGSPPKSN